VARQLQGGSKMHMSSTHNMCDGRQRFSTHPASYVIGFRCVPFMSWRIFSTVLLACTKRSGPPTLTTSDSNSSPYSLTSRTTDSSALRTCGTKSWTMRSGSTGTSSWAYAATITSRKEHRETAQHSTAQHAAYHISYMHSLERGLGRSDLLDQLPTQA
jgi:hypothetical protein